MSSDAEIPILEVFLTSTESSDFVDLRFVISQSLQSDPELRGLLLESLLEAFAASDDASPTSLGWN